MESRQPCPSSLLASCSRDDQQASRNRLSSKTSAASRSHASEHLPPPNKLISDLKPRSLSPVWQLDMPRVSDLSYRSTPSADPCSMSTVGTAKHSTFNIQEGRVPTSRKGRQAVRPSSAWHKAGGKGSETAGGLCGAGGWCIVTRRVFLPDV